MRYLHRYNSILLFLLIISGAACSSYGELVIENKVVLPGEISQYKFTDMVSEKKPGVKSSGQKSLLISSVKYLAKGDGFKPESGIMDKGVEEALRGNYVEAEILFKEIQENITDGSVENNLAVIYELTKRKKDAMKMYTTALIKSPENSKFRSNLLSYINHNKFAQ